MTAVQASLGLRELLAGKYRSVWAGYATSAVSADEVSPAAVCDAIVQWQHGDLPADQLSGRARKLKDIVGRALHHDPLKVVLTPPTIDRFVDSFGMSTAEWRRLHRLRSGTSNSLMLGPGSARRVRKFDRPRYETVAVVEEHRVGEDRLPESHLTTQTIRALEDGVRTHLYAFDANALLLDVLEGGRPRGGPPVQVADGVWGLDIELTRELKRGESTVLKYASTFAYADAPPPEFRRGAVGVIRSVAVRLTFATSAIPAAIYAAEWDAVDGEPVNSRVATPVDGVVERFDERLESGLVGFWWRWA